MLSMDAGAFAPMNYNYQQNTQGNLGVAGLGYASRGKAPNIRRINVMAPQSLSLNEPENAPLQTPRSSARAQLLSGLRTAPKTPSAVPSPVPEQQTTTSAAFDPYRQVNVFAPNNGSLPKSARSLGLAGLRNSGTQQQPAFPRSSPPQQQPALAINPSVYGGVSTASPISPQVGNMGDSQAEAKVYAELLAQNIYLAQQQQILQQQLRNVHQAQQMQQVQQQLQQFGIQSPMTASFPNTPMTPSMYLQNNNSLQNSGYYPVFNPLTGQYQYYLTQQQQPASQTPIQQVKQEEVPSTVPEEPKYQPSRSVRRSPSPPKEIAEKRPSPPPFRRSHKKANSLSINANAAEAVEPGPRSSILSALLPATPMNSTFGGKGEHPIRQPRGPPNFEEIAAKPTSRHEGSKNFATRQRRRAVFKLLNAGVERRGARSAGETMAPLSENEVCSNFEDSDSASSLHSGRHSAQSMHNDGDYSASSLSGDEMSTKMAESQAMVNKENQKTKARLVFGSSDKRKSAMF